MGGLNNLPRVLIDCRWLGHAGPGRVTELLLRGLASTPAEVKWVLWGAEQLHELAWPEAEVVSHSSPPTALRGQAGWFTVPPCDLAFFMHQQRPLKRLRSVSVIYDTIPLRFAQGSLDRWLKRRFLKQVVRVSQQIATFSEHSRRSIVQDLDADPDRVGVLRLPIDPVQADRLSQMRLSAPKQNAALFVGRFLPHKNLPRLVEAFEQTDFAAAGGRLTLVGGSEQEAAKLDGSINDRQRSFVEVRNRCSQQELDELFAQSLFLVQPSIEEGFGLPVWEALSCGMPVCASDGGSLPEITFGQVQHFPHNSVSAMSEALDACAARSLAMSASETEALSLLVRRQAPTLEDFAQDFYTLVTRNLAT